ncbi:MAG: hypothetical protein KGM18_01060 [Sphingomonadales bacterium]|nr:hypothetical protein [Sphingomonadales bacterium]
MRATVDRVAKGAWWVLMALVALFAAVPAARAQGVSIAYDRTSAQASYAAAQLRAALVRNHASAGTGGQPRPFQVVLAVSPRKLGTEAFAIVAGRHSLTVTGGDNRGLIYGALAVVEQLDTGRKVEFLRNATGTPSLAFRAIKFDLPWESYRASAALDQHLSTVRDIRFWTSFFDMMARNRFNAITLSNLHPWPYMVRTKGFPEANPFDDRQLEQWRLLHHAIFRLARERGIDTYLLPFNIFVSKEFAAAHGVGAQNVYPRYNTTGDNAPIIRDYVRASIEQVLEEYPDLTGLGINMGEGMGGMTAGERVDWIDGTYLAAIRNARRPVKLLWNLSSVDTKEWRRTSPDPRVDERMLRAAIERFDHADGPIQVGLKFNWSHALSSPKLVQIHGGKVGDTYFTPPPRNYRIDWIVRNEDVFALRWGVPSFVRQHIRANGSASYVDGYTIGSETYIPALDYFTAVAPHPQWHYGFERQWLFYMLWGRLLYDPATPDALFAGAFAHRYGARGRNLLSAYERASATPLRLASLFHSEWDHTLYSEGMLWLDGRSMAYIGVEALIRQPVLDPAYVGVADYVAETNSGQTFPRSRMTPPRLADRLDRDCREALRLVAGIKPGDDLALAYELADIRTWAHMGLHLAAKLRGAVDLQTYRTTGAAAAKERAVAHLKVALAEWDEVAGITDPLYKPMLLTHFTGQSSALNPDARFHWKSLRPAVAADVDLARNSEARIAHQPR